MREFWDIRYGKEEYVYGTEPNKFFLEQLALLNPGRILLPGEGEGRNAVHAASCGWTVDAFDYSSEGQKKALRLAASRDVSIRYEVAVSSDYHFRENYYDVVGLFFFHLVEKLRKQLHRSVIQSLKPGGTLILEAFHTSQLGRNTGGPGNPDMLFDEKILLSDFRGMDIRHMKILSRELSEGSFHQGEAMVVQFIAKKQ